MKKRSASLDAAVAVELLSHARAVCDRLNPLGSQLTMEELQQRAEIVDSAIRARSKLQLLRDRALAMQAAVDRLKARKAAQSR